MADFIRQFFVRSFGSATSGAGHAAALLLESGDNLLLENGSYLLLE